VNVTVSRAWLLLALLVPTLACSTPVGVERVDGRTVHRSLTANVLSTGRPSALSRQALDHLNLAQRYQDDPDGAIRDLRRAWLADVENADLVAALAELEFHRGEGLRRSEARPHFLAAAFYAHECLTLLTRVGLDPRLRLSADLYNRGLTAGLVTDDGEYVDLSSRTVTLSFGELVLAASEEDLLWGGYRMTNFVPVAELKVRGLRNRYRWPGVGAPLAAALEPAELESPPPGFGHISRGVRAASTAVVFFSGGKAKVEGDVADGKLRLYTFDDATSIELAAGEVPLEYEPTAALAFGLTEASPWQFERAGFLSGDFGKDQDRGLRMLSPYDPERIPVVFVHGTASGPGRFAEMLNHLQSDPEILPAYQLWLFQYNTGNPVPFSSGLLRQSLEQLVAELDPEGDDERLKQIVVIGHSQGGLLTKLCVVESGDVFWRLVSDAPIDDLELEPETREVIQRSLFFHPLPFVARVVFIGTPHRGSFLADRWFSRLASRFVAMPRELVDATGDLLVQDDDRILLRGLDDMPSSLDNMSSDNPFLNALAELPIAPGVEAHSIISLFPGQDDPETAHDGVVTLKSARHDGVVTELIVRSGHSTQSHPITMGEVRRILVDGLK
jgi:pimeloyl-ACP methyl ester carboxylesterase